MMGTIMTIITERIRMTFDLINTMTSLIITTNTSRSIRYIWEL